MSPASSSWASRPRTIGRRVHRPAAASPCRRVGCAPRRSAPNAPSPPAVWPAPAKLSCRRPADAPSTAGRKGRDGRASPPPARSSKPPLRFSPHSASRAVCPFSVEHLPQQRDGRAVLAVAEQLQGRAAVPFVLVAQERDQLRRGFLGVIERLERPASGERRR